MRVFRNKICALASVPFACPSAPLHPIWGPQAQHGDMAEAVLPPKRFCSVPHCRAPGSFKDCKITLTPITPMSGTEMLQPSICSRELKTKTPGACYGTTAVVPIPPICLARAPGASASTAELLQFTLWCVKVAWYQFQCTIMSQKAGPWPLPRELRFAHLSQQQSQGLWLREQVMQPSWSRSVGQSTRG